jgi:hypothetical protein
MFDRVREARLHEAELRCSNLAAMIMRMCRRLKGFDPDTKVHD